MMSSALEQCAAVMSRSLPAIDACLRKASETLSSAEKYDDKLASHVGWAAAQMVRISSELRQIETHLRTPLQTDAQRRALVLAYVRSLSPEKRADLATVLAEPRRVELAESSLERCTSMLGGALPTLDAALHQVAEMLEGDEYNIRMASHLIWMLNHLATIGRELRMTEKHDRAMTKSPAQRHQLVLQYLHVAADELRDEVARAIDQIEHSVSVLG